MLYGKDICGGVGLVKGRSALRIPQSYSTKEKEKDFFTGLCCYSVFGLSFRTVLKGLLCCYVEMLICRSVLMVLCQIGPNVNDTLQACASISV